MSQHAVPQHPVPQHPVPHLPVHQWHRSVSSAAGILGSAVALGALIGRDNPLPIAIVLGVGAAMLVVGWVKLTNVPSPRGTTSVLAAAAVLLLGSGLMPSAGAWIVGAMGMSLVIEFVHQLARRDGRPRLLESVSASVTGIAVLASAATLVPLAQSSAAAVAVIGVGAAAGTFADPVVRRGTGAAFGLGLAAFLGALAGAALVVLTAGPGSAVGFGAEPSWLVAAGAGGLAGAVAHVVRHLHAVLPYLFGRRAQLASAASSVLVVGILAHVAALLTPPA